MKRKWFVVLLCIEAAACVLWQLTGGSFGETLPSLLAFPFAQLGKGLRALSLSGAAGNILAIFLYAVISLIPAAALLFVRKRRRLVWEDCLPGILSILLFVTLYLMINPALLAERFAAPSIAIGKGFLGCTVYSVLAAYLILRALRLSFLADTRRILIFLSVLLGLLCVIFVYGAFGSCLNTLLEAMDELKAANAGTEDALGMSYAFLVLQYLADGLPYVLDAVVMFRAMELLDGLRNDRYAPETAALAGRLSRLCGRTLAVSVLVNVGFNVLQLIFAGSLRVVSGLVQLPLLSIVLVLGMLLLSRFIEENRRLKEDNDLFI